METSPPPPAAWQEKTEILEALDVNALGGQAGFHGVHRLFLLDFMMILWDVMELTELRILCWI